MEWHCNQFLPVYSHLFPLTPVILSYLCNDYFGCCCVFLGFNSTQHDQWVYFVLHLFNPNSIWISFENVCAILVRCSSCNLLKAFIPISSIFIKGDNLDSLSFWVICSELRATQNHKWLSESPWNIPRLILMGFVEMLVMVSPNFSFIVFHFFIVIFKKSLIGSILNTSKVSIDHECGTASKAFW